jgi:glycosyl transferase family 87
VQPVRPRLLVAGGLVALSLLCGSLAVAGNEQYVERDFHCMWLAGRVAASGGDPYDPAQYQAATSEGRPAAEALIACGPRFPYPPWTTLVFAALGSAPLQTAAILWISLLVAATVLGIGWTWQLAGPERIAWPVVALLVIFTEPFLLALTQGQFGAIYLALTAGAAIWIPSRHELRAGIAIAGLALKPQTALVTGPVLLALAVRSRQWQAVATAGVAALMGLIACVVLRPSWLLAWAQAPSELRSVAISRNTTWDLAVSLGSWTLGVLIIAVLLSLSFALVRTSRLEHADVVALGAALSLVVTPYAWTHDFMVLAIPWAVTLAHANELRPVPRRLLTLATMTVAALMLWAFEVLIALGRADESLAALTPILTTLLLAMSIRWGADRRD